MCNVASQSKQITLKQYSKHPEKNVQHVHLTLVTAKATTNKCDYRNLQQKLQHYRKHIVTNLKAEAKRSLTELLIQFHQL